MKHVLASLTIGACLLLPSTGVVFATGQPGTTAGVNCGMTTTGTLATPGHAALSPGAPFNEPAPAGTSPTGGKAGQVYAGSATKFQCRLPVRHCLLAGHDTGAVTRACPALGVGASFASSGRKRELMPRTEWQRVETGW